MRRAASLGLLVFVAFSLGALGAKKQFYISQAVDAVLAQSAAFLVRLSGTVVFEPRHHLQPAMRPGDGVTINETGDDGALILLTSFYDGQNEVRLIRRDGTPVARWPVSVKGLFPNPTHLPQPPATDWNVDLNGVAALPDGSVVVNLEYAGTVKFERCGGVAWKIEQATHHSVAPAMPDGFWIPGGVWREESVPELWPFIAPTSEDWALRVSADGEIVDAFSIPRVLFDNGLGALLTATGELIEDDFPEDGEITHTNKIAELTPDIAGAFPQFTAGDILFSIRDFNLLFVADPTSRRIKWWQVGPWLRQHDPEFNRDGTITVFNNNTFMNDTTSEAVTGRKRLSNILRLDPATGAVTVAFGDKPGQEFRTVIRGSHEVLDDGGFLITEFEGGRVFQSDAEGRIVWEYINRYDETRVAEITEARLYPSGYFEDPDWSCQNRP